MATERKLRVERRRRFTGRRATPGDPVEREQFLEGVWLECDEGRCGDFTPEMVQAIEAASAFLGYSPNDLAAELNKAAVAIQRVLQEAANG